MIDKLTKKQREAVEFLEAEGFKVFTSAHLEDVIELRSGIRHRRTWRRSGTYDLVLALRSVGGPQVAEKPAPQVAEKPAPVKKPVVNRDMTDAVIPNNHLAKKAPKKGKGAR